MKRILLCFVVIMMFMKVAFGAGVSIDGKMFDGGKLIDSVTYVPIRTFSEAFGEYDISWDGEKSVAGVDGEGKSIRARIGDGYIECNGRYVYSGNNNIIIEGKTYIPIRSIAKVLDASVIWNNSTRTAEVATGGESFKSADEVYNANDLYWLAKIINAESEGEPLEGKIAVGNVVLNRVENEAFPDSVYEVIFDKAGGVQFTPVANGSINKYPNEDSFIAAKICLENYKLSNKNILFFLNPVISTSTWIPNNRDYVMTIGKHDFYA